MTITMTRAQARPLKAWRTSLTVNPQQLTHAVLPGHSIAACGIHVSVYGAPWPDPADSTPLSRCPTCTKAVALHWSEAGQLGSGLSE